MVQKCSCKYPKQNMNLLESSMSPKINDKQVEFIPGMQR